MQARAGWAYSAFDHHLRQLRAGLPRDDLQRMQPRGHRPGPAGLQPREGGRRGHVPRPRGGVVHLEVEAPGGRALDLEAERHDGLLIGHEGEGHHRGPRGGLGGAAVADVAGGGGGGDLHGRCDEPVDGQDLLA